MGAVLNTVAATLEDTGCGVVPATGSDTHDPLRPNIYRLKCYIHGLMCPSAYGLSFLSRQTGGRCYRSHEIYGI